MNRHKRNTHGARGASNSATQQRAINITQNMLRKNLNNASALSNGRKLESLYTMNAEARISVHYCLVEYDEKNIRHIMLMKKQQGVLVGYPFGGATYALWSRAAPFIILAGALLLNLVLQYLFLDKEEFNRECPSTGGGGVLAALSAARGGGAGCAGACAGAVLLTTCVMAALEPCLPIWIMDKFHPQRWVTGAVFVPDSAAYLVATTFAGGLARSMGGERVTLTGQLAVATAALWLPLSRSVRALAGPHVLMGAGLGALDAALVPALLTRAGRAGAPHAAALVQAASAAAYALGPAAGGILAWLAGFDTAMRALGVANLLYAAYLYRALARDPLSPQWGAATPEEDDEEESQTMAEPTSQHYHTFH